MPKRGLARTRARRACGRTSDLGPDIRAALLSNSPSGGPAQAWAATLRDSLESGSGVHRVRAFDAGTNEDTMERAFLALCAEVGTPLSQNPAGDTLLRVEDHGFEPGDPRFRGPHSDRRLAFHSDRCDVIAFCCVRPAARGGENDLLSSIALYEELRKRHPDALAVLMETFPYLRHTVDTGNDRPFTTMPVFAFRDGHFHASLLRVLIDRADRDPRAPSLSDAQRAALDTLERIAEDPALYYRFRLDPGDVLFVNNWTTLHRRLAFEDDPSAKRLLYRIWLAVPNSRPIDVRFAEHFGNTDAGATRGGMKPR